MSQDDTSMERISLSSNDFSDNLSSNPSFGIEDSQLISSEQLNDFLLKDPETIQKVDKGDNKEDEDEDKDKDKNKSSNSDKDSKDKNKSKGDTEEKPDPRKLLEQVLYSDPTDQNQEGEAGQGESQGEPAGEEENTYATLGKDLFKLGVFTGKEGEDENSVEIKTPEEFLERFNTEKKKGAINILDNFLSQFGDDYRKMFDAVFVNGVEPKEYLNTFSKIESLSGLDLTQESNQEAVIRSYYKSLNWDDLKVENRIKKIKDYGDLEEEAKTFHEVLVNKERESVTALENKKKEENKKQQERELVNQKSYQRILNDKLKAQEFDGIPLTQKEAADVYAYMVEKSYKLPTGELISAYDKDLMELNNPENHELKVKNALLLRKKLDTSAIRKNSITKKSEALFTLTAKNSKSKESKPQIKSFF